MKRDGDACQASVMYLEARCLAFFGTTVVEGVGLGVVIRTGAHTTMGKIAGMTSDTKQKVHLLEVCMQLRHGTADVHAQGVFWGQTTEEQLNKSWTRCNRIQTALECQNSSRIISHHKRSGNRTIANAWSCANCHIPDSVWSWRPMCVAPAFGLRWTFW